MIRLSPGFAINPRFKFNPFVNSEKPAFLPAQIVPRRRNFSRIGSASGDGAAFDAVAYESERLSLDAAAMENMAETARNELESDPDSDPKAWKWVIRKKMWDLMEARNYSMNPRPVHHRIPNFVGASAAAAKLADLDAFRMAEVVKVNPDSPQKQIRFLTLSGEKKLLTPQPRLRTGFFSVVESGLLKPERIIEACTSVGVAKYGRAIGLDEKIKVDLIVLGSVAVNPQTGARLGKGEGFRLRLYQTSHFFFFFFCCCSKPIFFVFSIRDKTTFSNSDFNTNISLIQQSNWALSIVFDIKDKMTRVTRDFRDLLQKDVVPAVSADVKFASSRFPNYRIGANDQIFDVKDDPKVMSMKEVVGRETAQLLDQQKRMSVRDLANKFEKGLAAAAKLSEEAKLKEATSLEKHVLLKKLRDALESLRGRVAGRNKDDVEEAITMVEALAVQLTQREGELFIEKAEVKRLASFLKQASEDAKKLVDEERAFARAEIESARAAVQRVEEALREHEQMSRASGKQDMEDLMKEVQEARRIKMLHQPSKVMDMEYELRALRNQLAEKSKHFLQLQKKLAMCRKSEENITLLYEIDGTEALGSCLRVRPCSDDAPDLSKCTMQWYRSSSDDSKRELISGATKSVYAPEPFDVGRALHADIIYDGHTLSLSTVGKIDPAAGLGSYVEALVRKHDVDFNVVVTQMSGEDHSSESIHLFHVGKMRIKLCKGKTVIAKEYYSSAMQLCGVRGGGNAAAQAVYWQAKKGVSFVVAFESERERNAAIMLARRFACDCNVTLAGPDDRTETGLN